MQVNFTTVQVAKHLNEKTDNVIIATLYEPWYIAAVIGKTLLAAFPEGKKDDFDFYFSDLEIIVSEPIKVDAGVKASGCHDVFNQVVVMFKGYPCYPYQNDELLYEALETAFSGYFRFNMIEAGFVLTKLW